MIRAAGRAQSPAAWLRIDLKWVILGVCVAVVAYLAVIPLGFLLWQSFFTPHTAAKPAEFTLGNYAAAYTSVRTAKLFLNSLAFAVGTAAFSLVVGTALAWMNERTNTPFKRLFFGLAMVPLIIPGVLFTISWIMLASPKIGIFNLLLQHWFGTDTVFFNVYTLWGMIWVDGLHYSPMAFLLMTAAFRSMDPALEESAAMSGASIGQVVWRITLALSWPAIFATLLILFVRAIESFEVPALLGMPAGILVFTSAIYEAIHRYPSQIGLASAYGVTLLLLTSAGVWFQSRLSASGQPLLDGDRQGLPPAPHRPRPLALPHRGDLHRLLSADRRRPAVRPGLVLDPEVLQRALRRGARQSHSRSLSLHPQSPDVRCARSGTACCCAWDPRPSSCWSPRSSAGWW